MVAANSRPRLVVFSSLFPSKVQPGAGLFIRERMFRVGKVLPITVVAPVPWFPLQGLIRLIRPNYRPMPPKYDVQEGVAVWRPRFLSVPGLFRAWDGFFMALFCLPTMLRLKRHFGCDIIDAHFAYPDGYAATLLGKWLKLPVTITLRGTEVPHSKDAAKRARMRTALDRAAHVFSVSDSLRQLAQQLGAPAGKVQVIGNGVDVAKFAPIARSEARARLGLPADAQVIVSVGALVPRKGFHRVIDCLPELIEQYPNLHYLVVGGASPEGNIAHELRAQAAELNVSDRVHFLGPVAPTELKYPLSSADVFVLATSNEGWANVFLEAMACGLPVVTTNVGGNAEVVCTADLGRIVPFGEAEALRGAIAEALTTPWDRATIMDYAQANSWEERVRTLVAAFLRLVAVPVANVRAEPRPQRSQ